MNLAQTLANRYLKENKPQVNVGDTVRVNVKVTEGTRERVQAFDGTVIAKKHGGISETITVRRVTYGVGCEKVFPLHSPNIVSIETIRKGKVRRAKLYYLRDRVGKAAKVKERL
ncbi:MAG: 50S ribosomal protein L19 [Oscillospiraceae bacterium]|jgi:large subunit ribosomal protein L19|nr:50S ribosomal protein L19 [Oscillospiraceae bacterium]